MKKKRYQPQSVSQNNWHTNATDGQIQELLRGYSGDTSETEKRIAAWLEANPDRRVDSTVRISRHIHDEVVLHQFSPGDAVPLKFQAGLVLTDEQIEKYKKEWREKFKTVIEYKND